MTPIVAGLVAAVVWLVPVVLFLGLVFVPPVLQQRADDRRKGLVRRDDRWATRVGEGGTLR